MIPSDVVQFVADQIWSLDQLEVLLLLSALPDREWTVSEIDVVVRSNPESVRQWLESFVRSGIVARCTDSTKFRYHPKDSEIARTVASLGGAYKLSRHRIIELIYSKQQTNMKSLSDAFRFKDNE